MSFRAPRPAAALVAAVVRPGLAPRSGRASIASPTKATSDAAAANPPGWASSQGEEDGDKFSFTAVVRAMSFYLVTFTLALPLFAIMLVMFPFTYLTDKYRRYALGFVNDVWACVSTRFFFRVEVIGRENLPPVTTPAVYVANHASYLDIYSLFHLRRPFKFISKVSNFIIPIIGWSMYMTGHIALKRTDRKSQMKTLKDCRELLQKNCSAGRSGRAGKGRRERGEGKSTPAALVTHREVAPCSLMYIKLRHGRVVFLLFFFSRTTRLFTKRLASRVEVNE